MPQETLERKAAECREQQERKKGPAYRKYRASLVLTPLRRNRYTKKLFTRIMDFTFGVGVGTSRIRSQKRKRAVKDAIWQQAAELIAQTTTRSEARDIICDWERRVSCRVQAGEIAGYNAR